MSDTPTQGLLPGTGQPAPDNQGQVDDNSLASGFLKDIPEVDRNVVEKYVKQWDQNVQQQFIKRADEMKAYAELGSVEEIKAYQEVYKLINESPDYVLRELAQHLGIDIPEKKPETPPGGQAPAAGIDDKTLQGLPQEVQDRITQLENLVKQVAQTQIASGQETKEKQQQQELDTYLAGLRDKFGEFDTDYVLSKMANGMDGEKAVEAFNTMIGGAKARVQAPPALTGGGVIPSQTQKVEDMSRKDTQDLVASVLASLPKG